MTANGPIDLRDYIRDVPDFPKPGIMFKDITPMLADPQAFGAAVDRLAEHFAGRGVDVIAAAEARGFLFGTPLALRLGVGFVPIRKPGKLPYSKIAQEYALEYGTDRLEVHSDALENGRRVLLVDDVLATGGTMVACNELIRQAGGEVVACAFLIELGFLGGRAKLEPVEVFSVLSY
jgi:adenine phosphoribosyltransferase